MTYQHAVQYGRHAAEARVTRSLDLPKFSQLRLRRHAKSSDSSRRQSRNMMLAFAAALTFILVNIVDPTARAFPAFASDGKEMSVQGISTTGAYDITVGADTYVSEDEAAAVAALFVDLPFVQPDPGSAQAIAFDMVSQRGWSQTEFSCLVELWAHESGWRVNAANRSSGAYGIPQALPGSKMATAGADWATNPATQISWGLSYIHARYGTPCGAWSIWLQRGWY